MHTRLTGRRTALLLSTVLLIAAGAPAAMAMDVAPPPPAKAEQPADGPDDPVVTPPNDAWRGMTWRVLSQDGGVVGVGVDDRSNPYHGDTSAQERLPLLCIDVDGRPVPDGVVPNFYNGWAQGEVRLTPAINGTALTSGAVADKVCATEFGPAWRMAEFHDGQSDGRRGGWRFRADGLLNTDGRFWVKIDDQAANPWDSDGSKPQTIIPETTKVFGEADRAGLVEARGDGSLVFAATSPVLASLQVGDTVASLPTPAAPDGLLRKVTGIAPEGQQTVVTTTDGLLEEAVQEGDLHAQVTLDGTDADVARSATPAAKAAADSAQDGEGTAAQTAAAADLFSFNKKAFCLYDHAGDSLECDAGDPGGLKATAAGLNEYLSVDSEVNAKATAFVNARIRRGSTHFDSGLKLHEDAKLVVDGKGTYSFDKAKELEQWKKTYPRVLLFIGWVPLIITPELVPTIGTSGQMESSLGYEVTNTFDTRHGVQYDRGSWSLIDERDSTLTGSAAGTTGPADVSVRAGLKGSMKFYDSRNRVYTEPAAFAQATATLLSQTPEPSYKICTYGGLRVDVGADLPIFGTSWHPEAVQWSKPIGCWPDVPPPSSNFTLRLSDMSERGADIDTVLPDGSHQRLWSGVGDGEYDLTPYRVLGTELPIRITCLSHKSGWRSYRHTCDLDVLGTENGVTRSVYDPPKQSCSSCASREEYKFSIQADGTVTGG